jgi:hypothetical protein
MAPGPLFALTVTYLVDTEHRLAELFRQNSFEPVLEEPIEETVVEEPGS